MYEYIVMIYYVFCVFNKLYICDTEFPSDGIDRSSSHNGSLKNWKCCIGVIRHQGILPLLQNQDIMELSGKKWIWLSKINNSA